MLSCPKCGILKQGVPEDIDKYADEILDKMWLKCYKHRNTDIQAFALGLRWEDTHFVQGFVKEKRTWK
jgi:hypothetical protein